MSVPPFPSPLGPKTLLLLQFEALGRKCRHGESGRRAHRLQPALEIRVEHVVKRGEGGIGQDGRTDPPEDPCHALCFDDATQHGERALRNPNY